jgi:hypothetical protein
MEIRAKSEFLCDCDCQQLLFQFLHFVICILHFIFCISSVSASVSVFRTSQDNKINIKKLSKDARVNSRKLSTVKN